MLAHLKTWKPLVQFVLWFILHFSSKWAFLVFTKKSCFVTILTFASGNRGPPPSWSKFPYYPIFLWIFLKWMTETSSQIYFKWSNVFETTAHCKSSSAPQIDFGTAKIICWIAASASAHQHQHISTSAHQQHQCISAVAASLHQRISSISASVTSGHQKHLRIPHICHFWYATRFFRPVKGTPKKCVNSRQKLPRNKK